MANLTDLALQKLASPASGQKLYADGLVPGLFVRVSQGGTKTFVLVCGSDRKYLTIGRYPTIKLAEARTAAGRILARRTLGQFEPATKKFCEAYELFKAQHIGKKKARTQHDYTRVLEKYFLPKLRSQPLKDIAYEMITDITDKLADTPSEQAHALAVARTFFRWCVRPPRRYIPHSPLEGLQLTIAKSRKRVLTDAELMKVWNAALDQGYPHGTVVQLLILTGQRRGEIAALQPSWIDAQQGTITLPDWLTKNGIEHCFPFGTLTAAILKSIPQRDNCTLFFPTRWANDRPLSGWSKYKAEMNDRVPGWTLHDLRRTFRTTHAKIGTPSHIAERLINHASGVVTDVEQIYDVHTYMPEMRKAVEAFEDHLATLLAEGNRLQAARAA